MRKRPLGDVRRRRAVTQAPRRFLTCGATSRPSAGGLAMPAHDPAREAVGAAVVDGLLELDAALGADQQPTAEDRRHMDDAGVVQDADATVKPGGQDGPEGALEVGAHGCAGARG